MKKHQLFIPKKDTGTAHQPGYGTDMRAIETAFNNLPTTTSTPVYGITRMSRYYATVRSYRTSTGAVTLFMWTHTYQLTRTFSNSTIGPVLYVTPLGTPAGKLTITGAGASTSTGVMMMATCMLYIDFQTGSQTAYHVTWSYTPVLTLSKRLIKDIFYWPTGTVRKGYEVSLVGAGSPHAKWLITPVGLYTFVTTTHIMGTAFTVRALFTVVLLEGRGE